MSKSETWDILRARIAREQTVLLSLIFVYVASGRMGLALSFSHPAASLVWPPAGIAVGALLVLGYRIWPVIFGSSALLYAITLGPVPVVLGLAAGNTAEAVLLAYLVNRYASGRHALQTPRNSLRFTGASALACATSASTINALSLVLSGTAEGTAYGSLWMAQAIGSFVSVLLITPIIIHYSQGGVKRWRPRQTVEGVTVLALVALTGLIVFFQFPVSLRSFPGELLCMPVLLWAAFRLGRRTASAALFMLAILAVAGTLYARGPFVRGTPFESLTIVQFFVGLSAIITLSLASLASEYRAAEEQLRELVVTDPLTGLPNYRRLLDVLGTEIERARQTDRPFAVVFFDMDGLKGVNDEFGHLAGSRAVCRMAETLRSACRATDTAARYGGDEFVAVLTDTDYEGARLVVRRTAELLESDTDHPRLSASAGIAVYPRDGGTPTTLLSAADRALYAAKAEKVTSRRRVVAMREWSDAS
ncbi:MAG: diguanylate cyclase [Vicinamibacterales bacterium]